MQNAKYETIPKPVGQSLQFLELLVRSDGKSRKKSRVHAKAKAKKKKKKKTCSRKLWTKFRVLRKERQADMKKRHYIYVNDLVLLVLILMTPTMIPWCRYYLWSEIELLKLEIWLAFLNKEKWESFKQRSIQSRLILLYKGLKGKASITTDDLFHTDSLSRNKQSTAF